MNSMERLTLSIFEAAVVGCVRTSMQLREGEVTLSEESRMETLALADLCKQSAAVGEILEGMRDFLENSDASLCEKVQYLFRQSFIFGWHARGAIEDG